MDTATLAELVHILGPVLVTLAPLLKPLLGMIAEEIFERMEDHAEYSNLDANDDALAARLRARIGGLWPEDHRDA